jgi:hypothetical protein
LAEVEVLRLPWPMEAGGDRHLAADFLEGQLGRLIGGSGSSG